MADLKKNKTTDRVEGNMIMLFLSKTIDTIAAEHCIISWNLIQRLIALYRLKTTKRLRSTRKQASEKDEKSFVFALCFAQANH